MRHIHKRLIALAFVFPFFTHLQAATVDSDNVVVTASRFSESITSQSVGVQVITAEEIAANPSQSLPQLLSRYPGIYSRGTGDSSDRQIDMRGFGATGDQNTAVVLDGQRLNENELVTVKWSSIPLESIERIEILRGSGAVLFGGGATGGVIHIITKKAAANAQSGYAQAGFGSDSAHKLRTGVSLAGEVLGVSLDASHEEGDGYRDNGEYRQDNLEGSLKLFALPFGTELKFGLEDRHQGMPGPREAILNGNVNQLKTDRRGTDTPSDYGDRDGWHLNLLTQGKIGQAEWNLDIGHRRTERTALYKDYDFDMFHQYLDTVTNLTSFSPRVKIPHQLFGQNDSLVIGLDYENWDYDSFRGVSSSAPADADISSEQQSYALYALERLAFTPATSLSIGARAQHVKYEAKDSKSWVDSTRQEKRETEHAYELGLQHLLNEHWTLFAKTGSSFRLPTLDEIYNFGTITFLKPQTSKESELGFMTSYGDSQFRASIYRIRLDDEIQCVAPSSFGGLLFFGVCNNINLPPSLRKGLELEASNALNDRIDVRANYTYADSEFLSGQFEGIDVKGNQLPLIPKHRANLGLTWKMSMQTRLNLASQLVGEQRFDNDQTNNFPKKIPGYSVTDIVVEHEAGPWKFTGAINNLFDRKYYTYGIRGGIDSPFGSISQNYNAYPEPERTFFFSGEYRWR